MRRKEIRGGVVRLVLLCSLSVAMTIGCSSKQCLFESDCTEGLVCAESACRQACDETRQCPVDFMCQRGACYPAEMTICADDGLCEGDMSAAPAQDMLVERDQAMSTGLDSGGVDNISDAGIMSEMGMAESDMFSVDAESTQFVDAGPPEDSRFNLGGSYMVVHTVVFQNGGSLSEGEEERNNVELTSISTNRYRVEVRDDLGREVLYVDSAVNFAVNFAHRDGVGYYDFQYPWNLEAGELCFNVQIRAQEGSYRQGPRGYSLQGVENRTTCTCYPEQVNARVPVVDPLLCTGDYYQQVLNVEWIPW
jgi:hypothetical protein